MDWLSGKLLVAAPSLTDPNFSRAVIGVASHSDDGALGVILNRPAEVLVRESVPELAQVMPADEALFVGGPVQQEAILVMAEFIDATEAQLTLTGTIGLVGENTEIGRLAELPGRRRAFAGYAGWAPGQLEREIEREDWFLDNMQAADLFAEDPAHLWSAVLERMGGEYSLVARMPMDPSLN